MLNSPTTLTFLPSSLISTLRFFHPSFLFHLPAAYEECLYSIYNYSRYDISPHPPFRRVRNAGTP